MNYELNGTITTNARFTSNEDGSLKATGVVVKVDIVGAPNGKFIQCDIMPPFDIPKTTVAQDIPASINSQATVYVQTTYPNS